jgi:hypothetical protein
MNVPQTRPPIKSHDLGSMTAMQSQNGRYGMQPAPIMAVRFKS